MTYSVVFVTLGLEAEELFFFLPIIKWTDWGNYEHTHEDSETLNPGYLI